MWSVSDFLSQYEAKGTKIQYKCSLLNFFKVLYPEMQPEQLDEMSIMYLKEGHDYRKDIIQFRNSLLENAPKTRGSKITAVVRFLQDNEIEFPRNFLKNLNACMHACRYAHACGCD